MRNIERPKITLFDLETLPNLYEVLKIYPSLSDYPGLTLKATTCSIICAGWKELDVRKINCINAWDFPSWKRDFKHIRNIKDFLEAMIAVNDDNRLVEQLSDILLSSHAVVTHNGKRFDWKFLQTRLLVNEQAALPQINHIDTLSLAKSNLLSYNNRLATLAKHFTDKEKMEHEGWPLWVKVWLDDEAAKKKMEKYCKQDVVVLEEMYKILRPFAKNIPNYNLFTKEGCNCPYCGSLSIMKNGTRPTQTQLTQRYRCKDCRGYFRIPVKSPFPRV